MGGTETTDHEKDRRVEELISVKEEEEEGNMSSSAVFPPPPPTSPPPSPTPPPPPPVEKGGDEWNVYSTSSYNSSSTDDDDDDHMDFDEDDDYLEVESAADFESSRPGVDESGDIGDEEIDELLEQGLPKTKRVASKKAKKVRSDCVFGENELGEFNEKKIIILEEFAQNSLEVLPADWIAVRHSSGMPLYLHRTTRVCTLAKPYFLGSGSARRHSIPLSAIPCLAYRRQTEQEEKKLAGAPLLNGFASGGEDTSRPTTTGPVKRKHATCPNQNSKKVRTSESDTTGSENVVTSGNSGVNLDDVVIPSPDRQSLLISREETTSSSPDPTSTSSSADTSSPACGGAKISHIAIPTTSPNSAATKGLPVATVATAKENHAMHSLTPEGVREYCKALFKFKVVTSKRFKSWGARRRYTKEQKRIQLQRPSMPDGVKLISFPIHNSGPNDEGKTTKEYIMNPQGKSSVCILHEYVQHALRKQPTYIFRELENAATPYSATVVINEVQYGTGYGSSKKQAKAEAAKTALEILIPQMRDQLNGEKADQSEDFDFHQVFEPYGLKHTGIASMCKGFGQPAPYGLLLICLQRNYGQEMSNSVKFEMISPGSQCNKFRLTVGDNSVEVSAANKKEGKQVASQELLSVLHPNISNFGTFLKMYGNNSIKSVKEKKQEEQQITALQSKASANSPNWEILKKLKTEMLKLNLDPLPRSIRPWPSRVKDNNVSTHFHSQTKSGDGCTDGSSSSASKGKESATTPSGGRNGENKSSKSKTMKQKNDHSTKDISIKEHCLN